FFQAEDGIRDFHVTGVQTCALPISEISDSFDEESIRKFYVLVNKKGIQLNKPEIHKAEFSDTLFTKLVYELLENQTFSDLDLFRSEERRVGKECRCRCSTDMSRGDE